VRPVVTAVAALALFAAPASAGAGGHMSGTLTSSWRTDGWNGSVSVSLDPGTGPRDAAVQRIRSGEHYRTGSPLTTEAARVTALTSTIATSYDCGNGDGTTGGHSATTGAITDADVPFFIDFPIVDLLRGTGTTHVAPVQDNRGDPLPQTGLDFFPVPGAVAVHRTSTSCIQGEDPTTEDDTEAIFGTAAGESAVPFGVAISLDGFDMPLRRHGDTWAASGTRRDPGVGSVAVDTTYDLRLSGSLRSLGAICVVPDYKAMAKARSASQAVALVKRAGWPKAHFAGRLKTTDYPRGRYIVDPKFTSSGLFGCMSGKPKVFLVTS
jgi:hypothetical protein